MAAGRLTEHVDLGLRLLQLLLDGHLAAELAQTVQDWLAAIIGAGRLELDAALNLLEQLVVGVVLFRFVNELVVHLGHRLAR